MHSAEMHEVLRDIETGGAWLSSARVVRCWVKSRNERNPYGQLLRKRTLARLPLTKRRKVGMTSNHHALYDLGYTRTTMALNKEKQDREVEQNSETTSQFGLQAATRLHEVGIASNRRSVRKLLFFVTVKVLLSYPSSPQQKSCRRCDSLISKRFPDSIQRQ